LRDRSAAVVGRVMYDDIATPVDSLVVFNGKLAAGTYTLRVEDKQAGQTGSLRDWSLRIRGTEVHDLGGTLAGVPAGATLLLTGCGVSSLATSGAGGSFSFDNLVDCNYRITVLQSGFRTVSRDVTLNGSDITNLAIAPAPATPFMPAPITLPHSPNAAFASLTTSGGAGTRFPVREQQYVFDATTYDVDRPPRGPGNFPGAEDTNAFNGEVDPLTMTNETGPGAINATVDGPTGNLELPARVAMTIGQPVIGTSAQGDLRLSVGANP